MLDPVIAAYIFSAFSAIAATFQLVLALGAPWGEMTMGGQFPGKLPPRMRFAAIIQLVLLILITGVVLTKAGVIFDAYYQISRWAIWLAVILCSVSAILNIITPSRKERLLWSPVTIILLTCATIVALS